MAASLGVLSGKEIPHPTEVKLKKKNTSKNHEKTNFSFET